MTSNYSTIEVEAEEIEYKNVNDPFYILRISTTLYPTYQVLYCTGYILMTSNYSTIEEESEEIGCKNVNVTFYILRIYTTICHTSQQLYFIGHIQISSNYSTIYRSECRRNKV